MGVRMLLMVLGLRRLACWGLNNTNQLGDDDPGDGVSLS